MGIYVFVSITNGKIKVAPRGKEPLTFNATDIKGMRTALGGLGEPGEYGPFYVVCSSSVYYPREDGLDMEADALDNVLTGVFTP